MADDFDQQVRLAYLELERAGFDDTRFRFERLEAEDLAERYRIKVACRGNVSRIYGARADDDWVARFVDDLRARRYNTSWWR